MKVSRTACFVAVSFALLRNVSGQSFTNLNFEDATIIPDPSNPYTPRAVYASDAIPGWTATGGSLGPNDIDYNTTSTGAPDISILGTNGFPPALDGNFSVSLYGGITFEGTTATAVSISQTAIVPLSAESILFKAQSVAPPAGGTLLVSLGGQNIPFSAISTGSNYTLYGGNIPSAFAGESEQLMFSALEGGNNYWELDDIQFSTSAVPEPSVLGLSALGGLFLFWRIQRPDAALDSKRTTT